MPASSAATPPFFIGIDSDGTVFDSMEIKHKRVFQPVAKEVFGLDAVYVDYCRIAEGINLYSVLRGVNRFEGLALAFKRLAAGSPEAAAALAGQEALQEFVGSGSALSLAALADYNRARPSAFLEKVLEWSRRSDALYEQIMEEEGTPAFAGIRSVLERAAAQAELVVISSSSRVTLEQDWGKAGLLPIISRVEGQEQGNKSKQLAGSLVGRADRHTALMMGDALSDLDAANDHGILFYPITPGAEQAAWARFADEALERFFAGTYAGAYQESLLEDFRNVLQPDEGE
jgi:phosphoglycolate phosphatase-like HAD superfamily hydrolase